MYKILLVTDRPEILDAFQAVSSWESLGFRVPRICNSAEGAIACLKAHHVLSLIHILFVSELCAVS